MLNPLRLVLLLATLALVPPTLGCGVPLKDVLTDIDTSVEKGCELEAVLNPQNQIVATVCKTIVGIVGPIIAALPPKQGAGGASPPLTYKPLLLDGKDYGSIRIDIAEEGTKQAQAALTKARQSK